MRVWIAAMLAIACAVVSGWGRSAAPIPPSSSAREASMGDAAAVLAQAAARGDVAYFRTLMEPKVTPRPSKNTSPAIRQLSGGEITDQEVNTIIAQVNASGVAHNYRAHWHEITSDSVELTYHEDDPPSRFRVALTRDTNGWHPDGLATLR